MMPFCLGRGAARRRQKSDARLISAATAVANVVVIVMEITRETARGQRARAIFLPRSRCPKAIAGMDISPGRAIRDCGGQIRGGGIGDVVVDAPIDGLTLWRMDFPRAKACFWGMRWVTGYRDPKLGLCVAGNISM